MKILFITANRVGDAVLTSGVLDHFVSTYPEARFTIACGPYCADLFRAVPRLDTLIILNKRTLHRHWLGLWRYCVGTSWDLVVDMRDSLVSRLLRSKKTHRHVRRPNKHRVEENAAILGLDPPPAPKLWIDTTASARASQILPVGIPLVAFGPAANWMPKQWPIQNFIELGQRLLATESPLSGGKILVIADGRERTEVEPLLQALGDAAVPVIGYDLMTVAACLSSCTLFVGNDSGLMHMAAAAGIPTLGLFGPTEDKFYAPWGPSCRTIRTPESRAALLAKLPYPTAPTLNLMETLSVDRVYEAGMMLLKRAETIT